MTAKTPMPTLPSRDATSIVSSCAAAAAALFFAGGLWMMWH